ncbi:hypothetical protein IFM89_007471 [Coptis chinensis]|uniref:Uncharacterized protein n=1 Tax=Coptis chinensis TaxID=261450 RepID=A0A835LHV3_9MAGN|nr:hypothetical protein IFM89_007471 [Coptis chinensis]
MGALGGRLVGLAQISTSQPITFVADVDKGLRESISQSPEAYEWMVHGKPEHWANALFGGARLGDRCNKDTPFSRFSVDMPTCFSSIFLSAL